MLQLEAGLAIEAHKLSPGIKVPLEAVLLELIRSPLNTLCSYCGTTAFSQEALTPRHLTPRAFAVAFAKSCLIM